jgi:hypothetical protein
MQPCVTSDEEPDGQRARVTVLAPDKFYGGIIGAFLAALCGALVTGYLLPVPGVPRANPPGVQEAVWPVPGAVSALVLAYVYGVWRERRPPAEPPR